MWDKQAKAEGRRLKVFCASLADVFEDRQELIMWRVDLLYMIERTSHLDWLLLTKRPENVMDMIARATGRHPEAWLADRENVWIGTSVEDQKTADERIPHLLRIPSQIRFLSMEPLLGPVVLPSWDSYVSPNGFENNGPMTTTLGISSEPDSLIDWVIVGGESGHGARPMNPDWARSVRDQCAEAEVPFFFKQWGEWLPANQIDRNDGPMCLKGNWLMFRAGKAAAGRILDGQEWSQFPQMQVTP